MYDKWSKQMDELEGKTFHIRLPNSERIKCSVSAEDTAKVRNTAVIFCI